MAKKVSRRMVALSMASVAAVYLAGYAITEPAAQRIATAENADPTTSTLPTSAPDVPTLATTQRIAPSPTAVATTATPTAASPPVAPSPTTRRARSVAVAPATPSATAPPAATATALPTETAVKTATPAPAPKSASTGLTDGTFSATGVSRRGDVTVAVTVQSGRIAAVDITDCRTQYPESFIDGLPAQVVARQSAQVDLVSGATYSSRAFQSAVSQALAQARAGAMATG